MRSYTILQHFSRRFRPTANVYNHRQNNICVFFESSENGMHF